MNAPDAHPDNAVHAVATLERLISWPSLENRGECVKAIAEQVILGDPFITACQHLLVGALLGDDEVSAPQTALRFATLIDAIRHREQVNALQGGDANDAEIRVAQALAALMGDEAYEECVWCDARLPSELGEHCQGDFFCDPSEHSSFHGRYACPEGQI